MTYRVDLVQLGHSQVPSMEIYWMDFARLADWEPIVFTMAVVRGQGRTIVINTGPRDGSVELSRHWEAIDRRHALIVEEHERISEALTRVGVSPLEVDAILLTPLTAYTSGNLDLFPNAKYYISRKGWTDFLAPTPYVNRLPQNIYMPNEVLTYLLIEAFDRIVLLDDEELELFPGVRSFFVGGHHRSSMAYLIETADGIAAFSDCFFTYRNIEKNIPLGINESMEEVMHGYHRIREKASILIPPYDPEVYLRHPSGHIG